MSSYTKILSRRSSTFYPTANLTMTLLRLLRPDRIESPQEQKTGASAPDVSRDAQSGAAREAA
jgi:hypothetical protein